jgi:putative acetyltransferase
MIVPELNIIPYTESMRPALVSTWERSVRASHNFLKEEDLEFYRWIVIGLDYASFPVYILMESGSMIGFLGVSGDKIEMLFIDSPYIGKGYGKILIRFALETLKASRVDVNEQNANAVKFYSEFGFKAYQRMETDADGKAYPVLKMKLENV